jgi:hypothetical protein
MWGQVLNLDKLQKKLNQDFGEGSLISLNITVNI